MRKLFIALTIMVLSAMSIMAQSTLVNNPNNKAYFGIRLGGEITCPGKITADNVGISVFNNGGGVEFGGIYNIPVVANFYIEPGLKLYYNTYSMKDEFIDFSEDDILFKDMSFKIKKFGMRVPIMAGYHFDFTDDVKVSVFTGPELEIGFTAKGHLKQDYIDVSESLYGDDGGLNRVNLLWGIGAGISYQHFYFGVNGGIGMLNMLSDSDVKFHENRVTFSVGYNF
ncbi:outer membrane beta-barrel protein [Parabacteroides chinchillae]|nr:outer membrane beta-barrel protein [Parabacteroides chinchillae]